MKTEKVHIHISMEKPDDISAQTVCDRITKQLIDGYQFDRAMCGLPGFVTCVVGPPAANTHDSVDPEVVKKYGLRPAWKTPDGEHFAAIGNAVQHVKHENTVRKLRDIINGTDLKTDETEVVCEKIVDMWDSIKEIVEHPMGRVK